MRHTGTGVFKGIPSPFKATRYHSLMLERIPGWPADLEITCETEDGIVMGIQHRKHAIAAVQFHPESIASEHGHTMIANFLDMANCKRKAA
jgi:anthranilate synthase component 2